MTDVTSIAGPMWAAISWIIVRPQGVTLVGNINPRLYELGNFQWSISEFHDITAGNNDDSGIAGYAAEPGIDLVTGWGSSTLLRAITESCGSGAAMKEAAYPSA